MIGNKRRKRYAPARAGMVGSPTGLKRLPAKARRHLYQQLVPLVGPSWAAAMRDWRPTKIELFLGRS